MALKIRLRQQGCKNNIVYRIVVADSRSPRDGQCVETIGWYNPKAKEDANKCHVHADRLHYWITKGVQLGTTVEALMKQVAPEIMRGMKLAKLAKKSA